MKTLLLKNFLRSKILMTGLLILFVAGIISLHIGKLFLNKNKEITEKTAYFQQQSIDRNIEFNPQNIGLLLYYIRFGLVNEMPNLIGLSIGQRDINPSIQSVTIRNLEEQKYSTDFINPMYQMLGNMDFSFVLIYFFPLIIIAFCFNLISEEKEGGTWSLVCSQTKNPIKMLRFKILIRYFGILIVLILLLLIAKYYLKIPFNKSYLAYLISSILYISFWFSLVWLIISFQKNSSQNALFLLFSWVMFTIIIPAGINAIKVNLYPIPEAFSIVLESRDGYHNKWDEPKEPTIKKFYQHYPQFSQFKHPKDKDYSWLWYYAMQQMGDDEAAKNLAKFKEKLKKRSILSNNAGLFFPSIHTQLIFNNLCFSDMDNYLNFIENLENFHEKKRLYFYPKIFNNEAVNNENWKKFKLEFYQENQIINWIKLLFPTFILIIICLIWSSLKFKKNRLVG